MGIQGRLARLETAARESELRMADIAADVEWLYARFGPADAEAKLASVIQQTFDECGGEMQQWVRETLEKICGVKFDEPAGSAEAE